MKITILGCYSATPRKDKHTSSQLIEMNGKLFLIDCGEGTQMQLRKAKIKFNRINHIFISHLHGDHFYGLIGLISTFRLTGRTKTLNIYGPKGIKEIITLQLKLANSWTNYPLNFYELTSEISETIYEKESVSVETLPLDHRVYTNGFLFTSRSSYRKINSKAINGLNLKPYHFDQLKKGLSILLEDGTNIKNNELTFDPEKPKRYAYCSDTSYNRNLIPLIKQVDLLYHESTFLEKDIDLAEKTKHSTAIQAAKIAKEAKVKKLILGHYSSRYIDKNIFFNEASTIFKDVDLSEDFKTFLV